jgi:hypothetical protein
MNKTVAQTENKLHVISHKGYVWMTREQRNNCCSRNKIVTVQSNINILFRNSENNCCSAISRGDKITVIFLNSLILFQTTFLSFIITSHFYYHRANRKITIFSLSSLFSIPLFLLFPITILCTLFLRYSPIFTLLLFIFREQ